jgi:hypothetical protein
MHWIYKNPKHSINFVEIFCINFLMNQTNNVESKGKISLMVSSKA